MKLIRSGLLTAAISGLLFCAGSSHAATIFSDNFDSYANPYPPGFTTTAPGAWVQSGQGGLLYLNYPGSFTDTTFASAPNVAWVASGSSLTYNLATPALAANTTYTFEATIGVRADVPTPTNTSNYVAELFAGGNLIASLSSAVIQAGSFVDLSSTFSSTSLAAFVGLPLSIELVNNDPAPGVGVLFDQAIFDNISLDAVGPGGAGGPGGGAGGAVPEPGTWMLLGAALLGFVMMRRRGPNLRMMAAS